MSDKITFSDLSTPIKLAVISMIMQFVVFCGYIALFLYGFAVGLMEIV